MAIRVRDSVLVSLLLSMNADLQATNDDQMSCIELADVCSMRLYTLTGRLRLKKVLTTLPEGQGGKSSNFQYGVSFYCFC